MPRVGNLDEAIPVGRRWGPEGERDARGLCP